jgi:hypothetical protein
MENAEYIKKHWFKKIFLFGFGLKEKTKDPRKLNKFIIEIEHFQGLSVPFKTVGILIPWYIFKINFGKNTCIYFF